MTLRVYVNGFYTYIQPDDASIKATLDEYAEYNRIVTGQIEKFDFQFAYIFKMSTIIKGAVGFVIGLFIILLLQYVTGRSAQGRSLNGFLKVKVNFSENLRRMSSFQRI